MYNIIQANNRIVKNKVSMARGGAGAVDQGARLRPRRPHTQPTHYLHINNTLARRELYTSTSHTLH